jgi:hypothetical protein
LREPDKASRLDAQRRKNSPICRCLKFCNLRVSEIRY